MSFFGFDTNLPRDKPSSGAQQKGFFEHSNPFAEVAKARKLQVFQDTEDDVYVSFMINVLPLLTNSVSSLDFDDTYDGLGDKLQEANDDFNNDTFGTGADGGAGQGNVGKDFDFFGTTAQVSNAIGEEQVRYGLQHGSRPPSQAFHSTAQPKKSGYEKYQDPGFIPDIEAKSSAWKSRAPTQPAQNSPSSGSLISTARTGPARKMMSLEEVEAAMRGQGQPQAFPQQFHQPFPVAQPQYIQQPQGHAYQQPQPVQPPMVPHAASPPRPVPMQSAPAMSQDTQPPLHILQNPNRTRQPVQPNQDQPRAQVMGAPTGLPADAQNPVITHPQQLMELSEEQRRAYLEEDAKRAKRNHKIFLLSRGNGLMSPQDKNFITRIQLQQLVTATGNSADPTPESTLAEDFYYQVYSQIRGAPRQHPTQPLGHFAQTYLFQTGGRVGGNKKHPISGDNHMQRMQQQVQRAVEAAKLKPKNKQLIIEGSLGKISFSNAKTPKPLLNLKRQESGDPRPASARKATNAVSTSDRKAILKNIETVYTTLMRMEDHERRMPPPPAEENADAVQAHVEWRQELQRMNAELWDALKVLDPIVPGSMVTHPFIAFLSFAKGKKAIPRVFRQIDQEQRVTILTMIVVHLDQLDVIRNARIQPGESQPPPLIREEIELFSQAVMPSLLGYVSEAPINIMIGLLGLLIDHTNVINVSRTRTGLGMMTMLLSRAELAKETGSVSDQDWEQWTSLYNRLFDMLEPAFDSLFPGAVNAGDDMYIWQFLAAMGIGASPEQQQRLVIGVKDRVMETVMQSKTLPPEMSSIRLGNVNLFMRAIGLDVEMLG